MPRSAEREIVVRDSGRDTHSTERRNCLEEDIVDGEARGWDREGAAFDDADEKEGEEDPAGVRGELIP